MLQHVDHVTATQLRNCAMKISKRDFKQAFSQMFATKLKFGNVHQEVARKKYKLKNLWLSYHEKLNNKINNPINWENCTCCIFNFPLDVTSKEPNVEAKI